MEKSSGKKTAAKKTNSPKIAAKKTAAKKNTPKKAVGKKPIPQKSAAKKSAAKSACKASPERKASKKKVSDPTLDTVKKCCSALDDKKADNMKILDVRGKSPITNYFIIATATSEPHLRALAGELEKTLKELGVKSVGRDYNTASGWVVVDAFDFMAHIFLPEQRGMYGIESLWKDAEEISF